MTDAAHNPDDYCYRHPDRLSFVLCEKCGRTICLECQTHVDGKVLCPDDASRSNVTMLPVNRRPKRARVQRPSRLFSWVSDSTPIVTYSILAVLVVFFIVDAFTRGFLSLHLAVYPAGFGAANSVDVLHQPWSLLTSALLAGGILGLLFNGYSIFILGRQLERVFGRQKLLVLYGISALGASVLAFLLDGYVTSAIGAVFGLVGATVIMARRMGGNPILLYVTCAVSLVFAILFGSWQAAIGGGAAGVLTALTYLFEDDAGRHRRTRLMLAGLVAVLIVIAILRALVFGG
jgi:membrane associated rhomboid family serine protease